ncbi:MAG: hypothetical protein ACREL9_10805 [Gemmatimonadales bacterium]
MGGRAVQGSGGRLVLGAILLTTGPAVRLSAQVAPNRTVEYLHPSDIDDARALWVNPAGLGVRREASVYLDLTVADPGAAGRLRQLGAGFNSRGLSGGYQRDRLEEAGAGVLTGHTYRLGIAASSDGLALGLAAAFYRGGTSATGFDLGAAYSPPRWAALSAGATLANVGQPVVRGVRQRVTFVPGLTVRLLAAAAALSTHARITPETVVSYSFGLRWRRGSLGLLARLDTDRALRRGAFAFGLMVGGQDQVGAVVSTTGDARTVDAASVYGLSTRPLGR